MYTDEELKNILLDAIGSHQSLDHKLHLMEALTKRFDKISQLERELSKSEKERWKTARNLFKFREKIREIKEVVNS